MHDEKAIIKMIHEQETAEKTYGNPTQAARRSRRPFARTRIFSVE